jgi:hypothetical protein
MTLWRLPFVAALTALLSASAIGQRHAAVAARLQGTVPTDQPRELAHPPGSGQQSPTDPRDPLLNVGPKAEAVGDNVMVSTQLHAVTDAFMQHVNDYHQVSVFGATSGIYYEAATGQYHAFNGFSERPRANRSDR